MTRLHLPFVALCLAACAGSTVTRQTDTTELGRPETTTRTDTRIFANKDEAALDIARQDRRQGRYAEATAGFQSVYDNASAKPAFREQALFELARVHADLLNPRKDSEKAVGLFEMFLSEYPTSPLVSQATDLLNTLRNGRPSNP